MNSDDPDVRGISYASLDSCGSSDCGSDEGRATSKNNVKPAPRGINHKVLARRSSFHDALAGKAPGSSPRTLAPPPSRSRPQLQKRRSSLPGDMCLGRQAEPACPEIHEVSGRVCGNRASSKTATESVAVSEPSQSEWMAKLQYSDDERAKRRQACRTMMDHVEAYVPGVNQLKAGDRIRVVDKFEGEVERLQQTLARVVFDRVKADYELLHLKIKEVNELDEKMASMNKTYLREITSHRDISRGPMLVSAQAAVARVDEMKGIQFYEPLQYMSEDMRATVTAVVDEKLKAIFAFDPSLVQTTDGGELAKFEDVMLKDKVTAFERMNNKMREEIRELRDRLKKGDKEIEKAKWDLSQSEVTVWRTEKEKEAQAAKAFKAIKVQTDVSCGSEDAQEAGVQTEALVCAAEPAQEAKPKEEEKQEEKVSPKKKKKGAHAQLESSESKGDGKPEIPEKLQSADSCNSSCQTSDVADQANFPESQSQSRGCRQSAGVSRESPPEMLHMDFEMDLDSCPPSLPRAQSSTKDTASKPDSRSRPASRPASRAPSNPISSPSSIPSRPSSSPSGPTSGPQEAPENTSRRDDEAIQERDEIIRQLREELSKSRFLQDAPANAASTAAAESEQSSVFLRQQVETLMAERDEAKQQVKELEDEQECLAYFENMVGKLKGEAQDARDALEQMQEEMEKKQAEMMSQGAPAMQKIFDSEIRARKAIQEELDDLKSGWCTISSRNAILEAKVLMLESLPEEKPDHHGETGTATAPTSASTRILVTEAAESGGTYIESKKEDRQRCLDSAAKKVLQEKVCMFKAQLQAVIDENSVLHLSLNEMQQEVKRLMQLLRQALPSTPETTSGDLENVMAKMEKVARNGGAAYIRLHKEANLRQIAKQTRQTDATDAKTQVEPVPELETLDLPLVARHNSAPASPSPVPMLSKQTIDPITALPEINLSRQMSEPVHSVHDMPDITSRESRPPSKQKTPAAPAKLQTFDGAVLLSSSNAAPKSGGALYYKPRRPNDFDKRTTTPRIGSGKCSIALEDPDDLAQSPGPRKPALGKKDNDLMQPSVDLPEPRGRTRTKDLPALDLDQPPSRVATMPIMPADFMASMPTTTVGITSKAERMQSLTDPQPPSQSRSGTRRPDGGSRRIDTCGNLLVGSPCGKALSGAKPKS